MLGKGVPSATTTTHGTSVTPLGKPLDGTFAAPSGVPGRPSPFGTSVVKKTTSINSSSATPTKSSGSGGGATSYSGTYEVTSDISRKARLTWNYFFVWREKYFVLKTCHFFQLSYDQTSHHTGYQSVQNERYGHYLSIYTLEVACRLNDGDHYIILIIPCNVRHFCKILLSS